MKAVVYHEPGGPEVLQYTEVPDPEPDPVDVVVDVAAAALNRLDVVQRNGWYALPGFTFPHADVVLHDTDRPEWRPLLNVMNQLVWSADGRGVHTVVVGGQVVVDDYRMTTVDESALYAKAQQMGEAITVRSGLPDKAKFPMR